MLAALFFVACSNNEIEVNPHAGEVIEIDARVRDYNSVGTKVWDYGYNLENTFFKTGSQIRLFVNYDVASSAVMTYGSDNKFSYDATPLTFPAFSNVNIWAYSPAKDCKNMTDYFDTQSFNVSTDQSSQSGYGNSDLKWAVAEGVTTNPVTLNFKHALSKVKVTLNGIPTGTLTIKMKQLNTVAKVAPSGSSFSINNPGEKSDITFHDGTYDPAAPPMVCVVIPQTVNAGTPLIVVSNGSNTLTYNAPAGGIEFKSGHVYTFNLSYTGDQILDGSETVSVTDWNSTDDGDIQHTYDDSF